MPLRPFDDACVADGGSLYFVGLICCGARTLPLAITAQDHQAEVRVRKDSSVRSKIWSLEFDDLSASSMLWDSLEYQHQIPQDCYIMAVFQSKNKGFDLPTSLHINHILGHFSRISSFDSGGSTPSCAAPRAFKIGKPFLKVIVAWWVQRDGKFGVYLQAVLSISSHSSSRSRPPCGNWAGSTFH